MRARKWIAGAAGVVAGVTVVAAGAWACVSGPAVNLATSSARPGQEVQFTGTNFRQPQPVTVRWNALDGPVLAVAGAPQNQTISGSVTVPGDAKAGNYVLIFSQAREDGKLTQLPIRALLTVVPEGGALPVMGEQLSPPASDRPVGLATTDNSVSGATLALVGLGVAGVGMFVAGLAALFAGRRGGGPRAVPVKG